MQQSFRKSSSLETELAKDRGKSRAVKVIQGVLLSLSLAVGIAAYFSWSWFTQFARVETQRNDAAMELEINALGSSLALLQYFVDNDRSHFARLQDDEQDFAAALQQYAEVGNHGSGQTTEFTAEAERGFRRLLAAGDSLTTDEQALREITAKLVQDLSGTVTQSGEPLNSSGGFLQHSKNQEFNREFIEAIQLQIAERDYSKIDILLGKYEGEASSANSQRADFNKAELLNDARKLAETYDRLLEHAAEFSNARNDLDDLLDDSLQAGSMASRERIARKTWLWTLVGVVSSVALVTLTCVLGAWLQSTTTNLLESKVALAESRDKAEQALTETAKLKAQAERLALVAQHTDNSIVMTDAKGNIEWVNTGFTRVTGYSLEEVLGKKPGRLLQGERSDPEVVAYMRERLRKQEGFNVELINYSKDGREYWVEIEVMPIRNEEGVVTGFFSLERDRTAERAAEIVFAEAQRRSQAQVAAIDRVQGRMEFKPDGTILSINQNLADLMGYAPEELIGVHHRQLVSEEMADSEEYAEFWRKLASGETLLGEYQRVAKDGTERWICGTYSPLFDEEGQVSIIIKYAIDQTEQHLLEEQLLRAQKLESIGQLAAGIAHEINTPMQFVKDNIEYLSECSDKLFQVVDAFHDTLCDTSMPQHWMDRKAEMENLVEQSRFDRLRAQVPEAIEESREGVQRTIEIVRAMKEFSHPGAKEKQSVSLNSLVESTVAITRNRWKYVAEMHLELDPDLPELPLLASEINQVLLNLIVNAGDAIVEQNEQQEGVLGRITVRTLAEGEWVVVEVEDDGCGVPEEIQQRVFDPFFTTKCVGKGTGQGLSIAHNVIVNQHQGSISVCSEPGRGTKFIVKLPLAVEAAAQKAATAEYEPIEWD